MLEHRWSADNSIAASDANFSDHVRSCKTVFTSSNLSFHLSRQAIFANSATLLQ